MKHMKNSKDNQDEFAIIHVRAGLEGKSRPIGTIAISLTAAALGSLMVGCSVPHSQVDPWNAARGRLVAVGRAARGRSSTIRGSVELDIHRRELLIAGLQLVLDKGSENRSFRKAVKHTIARLTTAKTVADLKRSAA